MKQGNITNLIFDVGEVLLSYRWKEMLIDYGLSEADAIRVGTEIFEESAALWNRFDRGLMSPDEVIAALSKEYSDDADAIRWFVSHGEYMHVPRPVIWKLVRRLKEAGFSIYLLSNYSESLFQKHTQYADFMQDIDGLMVSYMTGEAKPEPGIYLSLLDKYHLTPENCLFFDDRLENVLSARELGMSAMQVTSSDALADYLRTLL